MTFRSFFFKRLLVAFADECAGDLLLHALAKSFFQQLARGMPDAEAGGWQPASAAPLYCFFELGSDAIVGDLDRHLLGGWADIFHLDGVGEFLFHVPCLVPLRRLRSET